MKIYIYALVDPRDNRVRYIGKSINPQHRLNSHLYTRGVNQEKEQWIDNLLSNKLKPRVEIIDECNNNDWQFRERYWISEYRKKEKDLTNIEDGGTHSNAKVSSNSKKWFCFVCNGGKKRGDSICKNCEYGESERGITESDLIVWRESGHQYQLSDVYINGLEKLNI